MTSLTNKKWMQHFRSIMHFIDTEKRNPSKYSPEERAMVSWLKYNKKRYRRGQLDADRRRDFETLLAKLGQYRRLNQYSYARPQTETVVEGVLPFDD